MVLAGVAGFGADAQAGGVEVGDVGARALGRGTAYTVGVSDPTAVHYNPAALARMRGTTVLYNHGLYFHRTSFQRAPLGQGLPDPAAAWGADAGTEFALSRDRERLFPLGLFAAVTSDFGLENWGFGLGVHGPSGVGKRDYAGYGPQSFQLTELEVFVAYYTLAAAWKFKNIFGIGASVQYVDLIRLKYGLVVDAELSETLNPIPQEAGSTQVINVLDLKDRTGATAQIGLWYRPHRRIELGASSRIIPVFLRPRGGVGVDKPELVADELTVEMPLTLPAIVRAGVRYIHDTGTREVFDIELDAVWENWSTIENYDLEFDGVVNGQELTDLRIPKNWKDTGSIRLGGDYHVLPRYLTVRTGGFFETAAVRDNYSHLDFPSFTRGGLGAGITGGYRGVYLTVGYMHVFQEDREVNERVGKVFAQRPLAACPERCGGLSGVPANAGRFQSSFDILTLGLDIQFRELLGHRAGRRRAPATPEPEPQRPNP